MPEDRLVDRLKLASFSRYPGREHGQGHQALAISQPAVSRAIADMPLPTKSASAPTGHRGSDFETPLQQTLALLETQSSDAFQKSRCRQ